MGAQPRAVHLGWRELNDVFLLRSRWRSRGSRAGRDGVSRIDNESCHASRHSSRGASRRGGSRPLVPTNRHHLRTSTTTSQRPRRGGLPWFRAVWTSAAADDSRSPGLGAPAGPHLDGDDRRDRYALLTEIRWGLRAALRRRGASTCSRGHRRDRPRSRRRVVVLENRGVLPLDPGGARNRRDGRPRRSHCAPLRLQLPVHSSTDAAGGRAGVTRVRVRHAFGASGIAVRAGLLSSRRGVLLAVFPGDSEEHIARTGSPLSDRTI